MITPEEQLIQAYEELDGLKARRGVNRIKSDSAFAGSALVASLSITVAPIVAVGGLAAAVYIARKGMAWDRQSEPTEEENAAKARYKDAIERMRALYGNEDLVHMVNETLGILPKARIPGIDGQTPSDVQYPYQW